MKYAFKMMAVLVALGGLVLQGCQTSGYREERFINADNITVCEYFNDAEWIAEAKRRGLDYSTRVT